MSPKGHQWLKDQSHQSMAKQPCLSMLDEFHSQTITIEHEQNRNKQIKNQMLKMEVKKLATKIKAQCIMVYQYGFPFIGHVDTGTAHFISSSLRSNNQWSPSLVNTVSDLFKDCGGPVEAILQPNNAPTPSINT